MQNVYKDDAALTSAIAHAREVAAKLNCTPCGKEHTELANWLLELQNARQTLNLYRADSLL